MEWSGVKWSGVDETMKKDCTIQPDEKRWTPNGYMEKRKGCRINRLNSVKLNTVKTNFIFFLSLVESDYNNALSLMESDDNNALSLVESDYNNALSLVESDYINTLSVAGTVGSE